MKKYYYMLNDEVQQPVSASQLKGFVNLGKIDGDTLICEEGSEEWESYSMSILSTCAPSGSPTSRAIKAASRKPMRRVSEYSDTAKVTASTLNVIAYIVWGICAIGLIYGVIEESAIIIIVSIAQSVTGLVISALALILNMLLERK